MVRNNLRIIAFALVASTIGSVARAQDDADKKRVLEVGKFYPSLEAGINLTQSAYSDNWAGGDKGSIVWTFIMNGTLENQLHKKVNWYNTLKLAYGQTHQQVVLDDGRRDWDQPEKSTDLIDFETIFRFTLGGFVDPFASARFESQFHDQSDGAGRTLALNPLKFKETAGIARLFIDEEDRSLLSRFGFSLRQGIRKQFTASAPDETTMSESTLDGGLEWITDYKNKILDDRVSWTSKLGVYKPLYYSDKDDLERIDADSLTAYGIDPDVASFTTTAQIDWENIFSTQITKLLSVSLYTRWIYDKYDNSVKPEVDDDGTLTNAADVRAGIRKAGQFKQTLSIGLTYRFL